MVILICIVIRGTITGQRYVDFVFTHMSCQSIRLLETIFSSSKRMLPYLQYDKELFASWLCHTLLTDLPNPHPFPIDPSWDIRNHDLYPFPAATLPKKEPQLVEQWQHIPQGVGVQMYTQASSKHSQKAHRMH